MSISETTRTLRYELRSREIYIEESINSLEILPEHPQTQDESINTIQETPNSQFRLVPLTAPQAQPTSLLMTPLRISYLPLSVALLTT